MVSLSYKQGCDFHVKSRINNGDDCLFKREKKSNHCLFYIYHAADILLYDDYR